MSQTKDGSQATLHSLTEAQMAAIRREEHRHVICHRSRFWMEAPRGFYQPVHWLARLEPGQISAPRRLHWGFRAALDGPAAQGNGSVPVHLLQDVAGYSFENFSSGRRYHLRRCRKRATIVEVTSPALLEAGGYEVRQSAMARTRYGFPTTKAQYLAGLARYVCPRQRLILAGFIDGKLGAYLSGSAVDGTAYIDSVYIASEALPSSVGTGLVVDFVEACRRNGSIREIAYGLHTPEDPALCTFKAGIGFGPVHIDSQVRVNPLVARFFGTRHPERLYRLQGQAICPESTPENRPPMPV